MPPINEKMRPPFKKLKWKIYDLLLHVKLAIDFPNFMSIDLNSWDHVERFSSKHTYKLNAKFTCLLQSNVRVSNHL